MKSPRPYQRSAIAAGCRHLGQVSATLLVMATGTGKSSTFVWIGQEMDNRVLIVAHRDELISQAADTVEDITGERPAVEKGEWRSDEGMQRKFVVTSVQTMCRAGRNRVFNPWDFSLVVFDEAHHSPSKSWMQVAKHYRQNQRCKILLVTATPIRADGVGLQAVAEDLTVAFEYPIVTATADGFLVPIDQQVVRINGLDFSAVHTRGGEFDPAELESILIAEDPLHRVAATLVDIAGPRQTIVTCCSVNHARLMADIINDRYRPGTALALWGDNTVMGMQRRKDGVQRFRQGDLQYLCHCSLFGEGFDVPNVEVAAMARPFKSIVAYTQNLGRITRPLPGVVDKFAEEEPAIRHLAIAESDKPTGTVIDWCGNAGRHKIVTALDVLGAQYSRDVREYAHSTRAAEGGGVRIEDSLQRASAEMDLLQVLDEERQRRKHIRAQAQYSTASVSPFADGSSADPAGSTSSNIPKDIPATEGQVWKLMSLGISEMFARKCGRRQASSIINKQLKKRSNT